jgi:hypothetical protein
MDTQYCSVCFKKLTPPFFLQDASSLPSSKVFATCYICREKSRTNRLKKKRPALQEIDPNIGPPTQRRTTPILRAPFRPSTVNHSPVPPVQPPTQPRPVQHRPVQPPPIQPPPVQPPPPDSYLPADQ